MNDEVTDALKEAMGYIEGTECCGGCEHFHRATNGLQVGGPQTLPKVDRCGFNVIEVPVDRAGHCKYFNARESYARKGKGPS